MEKYLRYLPIGDSYTIGEGVRESERWPNLLAAHLTASGTPAAVIANPARTGWTTEDALLFELPLVEQEKPDLITILIGVNDLVRGVPADRFEKNFREIVDRASASSENVVLITIPDFTLTPEGKSFGNTEKYQADLKIYNAIIEKEARERGLPVADIYSVSIRLGENPMYVAEDDLHPSPAAYIEWEKEIYRIILP